MEVVFARGTVTPEQQKKVPLTKTQDEEHTVDGELFINAGCELVIKNKKTLKHLLSSVYRGHSFAVQV